MTHHPLKHRNVFPLADHFGEAALSSAHCLTASRARPYSLHADERDA
jgi:hypothetical protein